MSVKNCFWSTTWLLSQIRWLRGLLSMKTITWQSHDLRPATNASCDYGSIYTNFDLFLPSSYSKKMCRGRGRAVTFGLTNTSHYWLFGWMADYIQIIYRLYTDKIFVYNHMKDLWKKVLRIIQYIIIQYRRNLKKT